MPWKVVLDSALIFAHYLGKQVPHELCNLKCWPILDKTGLMIWLFYIFLYLKLKSFASFLKRMIAFNVCTDLVAWLVKKLPFEKKCYFYSSKKWIQLNVLYINFGTKEANVLVIIFMRWQSHHISCSHTEQSLTRPTNCFRVQNGFCLFYSVSFLYHTHMERRVKKKWLL